VRDGGATYHYVLLTVENKTETSRPWKPHVRAVVDGTKTHVACGCSGAVEQVRRRERDSSLLSVEASAGPLAPGQSKRIAAVFGPIDSGWNRLTLLVGGLVNPLVVHRVQKYGDAKLKVGDVELDPVVIADAAYEQRNTAVLDAVRKAAKESGGEVPAPTVEYREFMENRAYAVDWQREGDEFRPELDTIDFVREGWKVIGEPVVFRTVTPRFVSGS
jgi:hypothetical protein